MVVVDPQCDGPARSVPQATHDSLMAAYERMRAARPGSTYVAENYWRAGLAHLPGRFAGIYLGSAKPPYLRQDTAERTVVILLADTMDLTGTMAALEPHLAPRLRNGMRIRDAVVRKARWDYAQLLDWQQVLIPIVIEAARGGFTDTNVGESSNRVYFGVVDSASKRLVESRLAGLHLPCDLVDIELHGRMRPAVGEPAMSFFDRVSSVREHAPVGGTG
jgi:hypothetical protein